MNQNWDICGGHHPHFWRSHLHKLSGEHPADVQIPRQGWQFGSFSGGQIWGPEKTENHFWMLRGGITESDGFPKPPPPPPLGNSTPKSHTDPVENPFDCGSMGWVSVTASLQLGTTPPFCFGFLLVPFGLPCLLRSSKSCFSLQAMGSLQPNGLGSGCLGA